MSASQLIFKHIANIHSACAKSNLSFSHKQSACTFLDTIPANTTDLYSIPGLAPENEMVSTYLAYQAHPVHLHEGDRHPKAHCLQQEGHMHPLDFYMGSPVGCSGKSDPPAPPGSPCPLGPHGSPDPQPGEPPPDLQATPEQLALRWARSHKTMDTRAQQHVLNMSVKFSNGCTPRSTALLCLLPI